MKHYSIAERDRSFTVRYIDENESRQEACVAAESVTEAITIIRSFVMHLKSYPASIIAIIEGCDE